MGYFGGDSNSRGKFMIGLTLVAIIFIGYIAILNYPNPGKELSGTNYYTSDETTTLGKREGSSYGALSSVGRVECPGTDNRVPVGNTVTVTGVTTSGSLFGISYLPYTMECAGISVDTLNKSTFSTYVNQTSDSPATVGELFSGGNPAQSGYTEILAPFSYTFESTNTGLGQNKDEIIIVNRAGNCRMIISGCVNWFCAGAVGTETNFSNIQDPAPWEDHDNHHMTRIGYGTQQYESGSAGDLIAYGSADTTIEFSCYLNGSWQPLSFYDACKTARIQ